MPVLERSLASEFGPNLAKNGHVTRRPCDALSSQLSEGDVSNIVVHAQFPFV